MFFCAKLMRWVWIDFLYKCSRNASLVIELSCPNFSTGYELGRSGAGLVPHEGAMEITEKDIERLADELSSCRALLFAIGDETRQRLVLGLLQGPCEGTRVVDLAQSVGLSRPATSHHMQILKEAGIVKARREEPCVYYYLDPDGSALDGLAALALDAKRIVEAAPNRAGAL